MMRTTFILLTLAVFTHALSNSTVELVVDIDMPSSPWCFLWGNFATKLNVGDDYGLITTISSQPKTFELTPSNLSNVSLSVQTDMAYIAGPNFRKYAPTSDYAAGNSCGYDSYDCTCWNSEAWTESNSLQEVDLQLGCRSVIQLECSACPRWYVKQLNVDCV